MTHKTFLIPNTSKCLHYYFYFIDETLGLCYVRVPTWCPFRLQIYFNGHAWLASQLDRHHIRYRLIDNAFDDIDDFEQAQQLADNLDIKVLHQLLDKYARLFCPVQEVFQQHYQIPLLPFQDHSEVFQEVFYFRRAF